MADVTSAPPIQTGLDKETVVSMLRHAAELEHNLCLQYLYAAFTLKQGGDPGLSPSQAATNGQWYQQVTRIAIQEMYHLLLASNLLAALGEAPSFWRPNFPLPAQRYSDIGLVSTLAPFDFATISRFLCWEQPDADGWWKARCHECSHADHARLGLEAVEPPPYGNIGQLYFTIRDNLSAHPEWFEPASASRQVTSALVPFTPTVAPIVSPEQASRYINIIVREGEGTPNWESTSHFAYFFQLYVQLQPQPGQPPPDPKDPHAPAWPTVENPVYDPAAAGPGTSFIDDPAVQPVGRVCNDLYQLLVLVLGRLFNPNGESPPERQALANLAMALMPIAIEPISRLLTRMPAGSTYPGLYAGPGFELPPVMEAPLRPRDEEFADLEGRLRDVTSRCRMLSVTTAPPAGAPAQVQLDAVAARLEKLLPLLQAQPDGAGR